MAKGETKVIFIDRIHSPDKGVLTYSHLIDQYIPWGVSYCKYQLIPQITKPLIP